MAENSSVEERLLESVEPSIRWKILVGVLGEEAGSKRVVETREEIRRSPRVQALLAQRDSNGEVHVGYSPYYKWQGPHWILSTLADIGYPTNDESLRPMADQLLDAWLDEQFFAEFNAETKKRGYSKRGVAIMQGRHRRCASQQANALWTILTHGLYSSRCDQLAERLLHWQWPDGGWNCDKNPDASTSSFVETLFPLRALALYARSHPSPELSASVDRAAEVFLTRYLFKRRSTGALIRSDFTKLHYPLYWHYDILGALKAMAEAGKINDPRCEPALDLLEAKRLPNGGWPAEAKYYTARAEIKSGSEYVDWGGTGKTHMNEWVTADALSVLMAAGRDIR